MANNNAFKSPIVASVSPELNAAINNGTATIASATTTSSEASFEWGTQPTTQYILVETTMSGKSVKAPQLGVQGASKTLANIWPGAMYWTENTKQAGTVRLFAKLNAMVLQRNDAGIPLLDEEGELTWKDGVSVTLCKQGLTKAQRKQIAELESAKSIKPELVTAIDSMIAGIQANAGWVNQKLDSKAFVTGLCDSGDSILPVVMYLNMAFSAKESAAFIKAAVKLGNEPGLLRFYIPVERLAMPKSEWKPVKVKVGNSVIDLKNPNTGEIISGPEFSWGNRTQPIAKIELIPGKYLPSSEGMDRVLSAEESAKRVAKMERTWESNEELDIKLWAEALKGKFSSSGNMWAHKAGALPKRNAGAYVSTCTMWEDTAEFPVKFDKWSESLRALVGVKPRLTEENQKGNNNKFFSAQACEAIIASATIQSIQPWVDFVESVGGGNTINTTAPVATTITPVPAVVEVIVAPVVPSEPEVKAIAVSSTEEASLSEADFLAAILAARAEEGLDDLEEEEDLTSGFFGGNIQE
jgi:hypothetical protein